MRFAPVIVLATVASAAERTRKPPRTVVHVEGQSTVDYSLPEGSITCKTTDRDGTSIVACDGIPYATPPVGDRRWRPPIDPNAWGQASPLNATVAGGCCDEQEDCLFGNVYTPYIAADNDDYTPLLPVLLWIHGGAYQFGCSSLYDGGALAAAASKVGQPVIVVTVNYRLGAFGFMGSELLRSRDDVSPEGEISSSGAYGIQDQRQAIKWFGERISTFGGDPDQITIFGQSAGAGSVANHLANPASAPWFARAIGESGLGARWNAMPAPLAEAQFDWMSEALECTKLPNNKRNGGDEPDCAADGESDDSKSETEGTGTGTGTGTDAVSKVGPSVGWTDEDQIKCLLNKTYDEVGIGSDLAPSVWFGVRWAPMVDSAPSGVPEEPAFVLARGGGNSKPLIAGTVRNELKPCKVVSDGDDNATDSNSTSATPCGRRRSGELLVPGLAERTRDCCCDNMGENRSDFIEFAVGSFWREWVQGQATNSSLAEAATALFMPTAPAGGGDVDAAEYWWAARRLAADMAFTCSTRLALRGQAGKSSAKEADADVPVYGYMFDHTPAYYANDTRHGVYHSDELLFVFPSPELDGAFEHALSDRMVRLWASFAAGTLDDSGEWPRYTAEGDVLLRLGNATDGASGEGLVAGWEAAHCDFLEGPLTTRFEF